MGVPTLLTNQYLFIFIPRREEQSGPNGVHIIDFSVYMYVGNQIWVMKNTIKDQLFLKAQKPFIPQREVRTHCPDGVLLAVFPIYIPLVNENWGFKNTNVNRPFLIRRKPLLSGWVGWWVVVKRVLGFSSNTSIGTSKMC